MREVHNPRSAEQNVAGSAVASRMRVFGEETGNNIIDPVTGSKMVTADPYNAEARFVDSPHALTPDVFIHASFVNTYAVKLPSGLLLIDPGFEHTSELVHESVRAWSTEPLASVVLTHHHVDHACGMAAWHRHGEHPSIVAHENVPAAFRRYELTHGWNAHINQRQFGLPEPMFASKWAWPTVTYRDELSLHFGDCVVQLKHEKGETDDATVVWIPSKRYLFTGDLVIWSAPNCGNPQKVQRYPAEWADALERMASLGAEFLFPGHGLVVRGEAIIRRMLLDTARFLRSIVKQVVDAMNRGMLPEDIYHSVVIDDTFTKIPFLRASYDHPKFIVRNILRLYGGWWNGRASDLLPASQEQQAQEVVALGGLQKLLDRAEQLLRNGDLQLACHLSDWAYTAEPSNKAVLEFRDRVYTARLQGDVGTMERGCYEDVLRKVQAKL